MKELIILMTIVIIAIGVVAIYDARRITQKYFGSEEINKTTKTIKIVGGLISLIAMGILVMML